MVHSVVEELAGLKQGFTDIIPPHVLAGECPDPESNIRISIEDVLITIYFIRNRI